MTNLPHLRLEGSEKTSNYTYAGQPPSGTFALPSRNKPVHAKKLRTELEGAATLVIERRSRDADAHPELLERKQEGMVLTFRGDPAPDHDLKLDGLERRGAGIHLLGVTEENGAQIARIFVPENKLQIFLKLVDEYAAGAVLTFEAEAKYEEMLKGLAARDEEIKIRGSIKNLKDERISVTFIVPEAKADVFINQEVGRLGNLAFRSSPNEKLIESITSVRLAIVEDFWQDSLEFPTADEEIWWEVWLRGEREKAVDVHKRFIDLAKVVGISRVSNRFVAFPERVVVHARATARQFSDAIDLLAMLAELRKAKEIATDYVEMSSRDQKDFVDDMLARLVPPGPNAPSICLLDGGVNRPHPLIKPALDVADQHTSKKEWGVSDHDEEYQHGTRMAGIALYGCLTEAMRTVGSVALQHRLESVKILPPPPERNEPPDYGRVMQDGVLKAHIQAPRRDRAICMAVTADSDRDNGLPSLWSGAVDDMCAGVLDGAKKLMFISAGNVRKEFLSAEYVYHDWNTRRAGIEDPGQAWNALTIGAMTEKVNIQHKDFQDYHPIANSGDLCPTSRTSLPWSEENYKGWPIKPDLVMEGGNYASRGTNKSNCDDLSLLTTILHSSGRLLETTRDTSPATALAARMAAMIWIRYPRLWPETVRALLVHSARWTSAMKKRFPDGKKNVIHRRLRCYGYGAPDLQRALNSAENAVTLIYEGELQPYRKDGSDFKTHEMHTHELPWPIEVLEELGEGEVTMRVTLSYFIEPSPNRVGWGANHRYLSHGLRFDVIRPTESLTGFAQRISKSEWDDPKKRPNSSKETRNWTIGENGRTNGSLHSDWWTGTAADLARCGRIAVYPVTGWWKERHHLGRYKQKARYSLIVSIESKKTTVDLYTPIATAATVQTAVME